MKARKLALMVVTTIATLASSYSGVAFAAVAPTPNALSPRCNQVYVASGVTLQACVSADLQHVYGNDYLYVNATGYSLIGYNHSVNVAAVIEYSNSIAVGQYTNPRYCSFVVTGPATFTCSATPAPPFTQTNYYADASTSSPYYSFTAVDSPVVVPY